MTSSSGCRCQSLAVLEFHRKRLAVITSAVAVAGGDADECSDAETRESLQGAALLLLLLLHLLLLLPHLLLLIILFPLLLFYLHLLLVTLTVLL